MLISNLSRRRFLEAAAAGTAILTMPRFLAGCPKVASPPVILPTNPFLEWFGIDQALIGRAMAMLTSRGADIADIYFQHKRANTITMQDGIISEASSVVDQGVGLRVVVGDQTGYAFTEDLSHEAIMAAAETASAIANGSAGPLMADLSYPGHAERYRLAVPWADVGVDRKLPLLRRVEELARSRDPAIEKVIIHWADTEEHILIADIQGAIHTDLRPMTRLWCTTTARRGDQVQSNSANMAGRRGVDWYTDDRLKELAGRAVDKTMILFEAIRPPAGDMPVVLAAGPSGILLHEAIGHGMEADFNRKGTSIYSDLMGSKVAPEFVTIVDDATPPHERGSLNIDDEGVEGQRTVLVEKGILKSYMHDQISARHYGVDPTGSGRRQSFRHHPIPRMRCTYMENGNHGKDEIIAQVEKGIIAETFTNGQVTIGAGDFTFYIKNGWLIENGTITAPIKDCNIIGNGPRVLRNIQMVADDGRLDIGGWTCGKDGQSVPVSQGLPTVLVSSITVGGENA